MNPDQEDNDKPFEPTPQKLVRAREKGDVARSAELGTAASYLGLCIACLAAGPWTVQTLGVTMMVPLQQAHELAPVMFDGSGSALAGNLIWAIAAGSSALFLVPAICVILSVLAQNAFVFAPQKLMPKRSRISPIENAKNKYGRNGLFEFSKSAVKLIIYCVILGVFIVARLDEIMGTLHATSGLAVRYMAELCIDFLFIILVVAAVIGGIDWIWQQAEFKRKNRMSRKEIMDETKDAEGDPQLKNERRMRARSLAGSRMMIEVPLADVVVVNPTHYAVALKWTRAPGSAPKCVAKGVDEIAATIRQTAESAGVPIHHDPPTARALHAAVEIGSEIPEDQYRAVAVAIRFAENMRRRARMGVV